MEGEYCYFPAKTEKIENNSWIFDPKIIQNDIRKKTFAFIVAALSLFLALQYNEFLTEIIKKVFFLQPGNSIAGKLVYMVILTIVIISIIIMLEKKSEKV